MRPASWFEQVALITGGASGIGRSAANALAEKGVKIVLLDSDEPTVRRVNAELSTESAYHIVDVTDPVAVDQAVARTIAQFGRLDILINSAGITGLTGPLSHEVEPADFERVWRVNVMGSFHTFRAAIPQMLLQKYGRVLHLASIAGKEGNARMLAYSASKAAVIGMTKTQGKDYATTGITVNALAPAVIRTPIVEAMPKEQVAYMTQRIPMERCGSLAEVGDLIRFIVSPENSFTTGFCYDLSGGRAVY